MNKKVKRLISFRFDRPELLEEKLTKMAAKGLILEECGNFFWTFRKDAPQERKYSVTYFSEASIFNPDITYNQQTYFDFAKAAGWDFVAQFNQLQIFSSVKENPIPFETDDGEKVANIKKSMKKTFIPSAILIIIVFALNIGVQLSSYNNNPIRFLSDATKLLSIFLISLVVLYYLYILLDYILWIKKSEKSIANGGKCASRSSTLYKFIDRSFLAVIFAVFLCFIYSFLSKGSLIILLIAIVQIPLLYTAYNFSIKYLKKKKCSAKSNFIISSLVIIFTSFIYLALLVYIILNMNLTTSNKKDYRTVNWQVSPDYSHEYKLYSDDIPLTAEDLYGDINYDYYTYSKEENTTIFLTETNYYQRSLPAKDAPPSINYQILVPKFDFVYSIAEKHLLTVPHWHFEGKFNLITNDIFSTTKAYQKYYDNTPSGEYILFYEDRIITIDLEGPATEKEIAIIREKLGI